MMINYTSLFELSIPPNMNLLAPTHWPEILHVFRIQGHGRIWVTGRTQRFGFQIRARDAFPHPSLLFGLAQVNGDGHGARFAVRIDFESGEVWDAAHEGGLLGSLESSHWQAKDEEHPLVLRWEIDRAREALIPRLFIGQEEFLYPSMRFQGESPFVAFTGHDLDGIAQSAVFSPGYFWSLDRLP